MAINRIPRGLTSQGRVRENGIYIAKVKDVGDAQRMGRISVWIPEMGGDPEKRESWIVASYAAPFAGATSVRGVRDDDQTMEGSQQSYGFWMVPPDLENEVLVCFSDGDTSRCFWFACIYQQNMNHMIPGIAVGRTTDPNWTQAPETSNAANPAGIATQPAAVLRDANAPRSGPTPATSAEGYNVGYYSTLSDAQAGAQRYTEAANFVRSNPNLYTAEEQRAAFRLEAAANAEVTRLSGTAVAAATPAPSNREPVTLEERQSSTSAFFLQRGYSAEQTAALVANLQRGSNLSPILGRGDTEASALGLGAWDSARVAAITTQFGKSPSEMTFAEQLEAVDWEIRNSPNDRIRTIGEALLQGSGLNSLVGIASGLFGGVLGTSDTTRGSTESLASSLLSRSAPDVASPAQLADQATPTLTAPVTVAQQAARDGGIDGRVAPVVEYNKANVDNVGNPRRPIFRPLAEGIMRQGLSTDNERGFSSTSARREAPSKVFGFLTPRGNTIHVDDDENNEFIRMRTRSGAQILIHETTGYVYINSKSGNSWAEISDAGIDFYTDNSYSVHTGKNINFRAEGNIILDAGGFLSLRAANGIFMESGKQITAKAGEQLTLTAEGRIGIASAADILQNAGGAHRIEASGDVTSLAGGVQIRQGTTIQDNGTAPPTGAIQAGVPAARSIQGVETTSQRMPSREPWSGHPRADVPRNAPGGGVAGGRPDGGRLQNATDTQSVRTGEGDTVDVPRNSTAPRCYSGARTLPVSTDVYNAIRDASDRTGVPFGYMMATAHQESAFRPTARASTSSASGLYQFIDGTWNSMVARHGATHNVSAGDRLTPRGSALMGAEYARTNANTLRRNGLPAGNTELYLSHFLGAGGATTLLREYERNPNRPAAELNPAAAAANRSVYYNRDGTPRSVAEIRQWAEQKIEPRAQAYAAQAGQPAPCEREGSSNAPASGVSTPAAGTV